ncbi:helicase [Aureococcus anophagefferens]|nr:helicase [Aureococcus anophagefferens]
MKTAQSKLRVTRVQTQPSIITAKMRPYQLEGLNWLVKLHDNGINGILADEMGLGKTLQSISLLAYLHETRGITGPHICIVPKSVTNNWMRELRKWCPTLRPVKLLGSKDERARVLREDLRPGTFDVLVTSYEGILKEKAGLMKIQWQYLLIDEAHRIKNPNSSLSKIVRLIPTQFRLLITGTPLQNNLNELWALLNFLLPDIFASEADFETWFSLGDADAKDNVVKKLHTVLRPFMLRRIKKDVEKDLPPKREDAHTLNALGGPDRVQLLNILMQLRKVCNHPYLFEGAEPGPPFMDGPHLWENTGKLVLMSKLLPKLMAQDSRVLIFSQMTRMLDILEDYMRLNQYKYCRIDGSTSGDDRDSQMDVFNAPGSEKFAFLLSTRAGGLGINLATADIVVLYDSDWNPQGTVEEKIIERADRKLFLDAAVIQQGRLAEQNAALGKNDLMAMVRFGADEIFASKAKTITDEDIDTLLKRGEERTQEQASKIQSDVQHNLANFSLTTMEEPEGSLFNFEGENYKGAKGGGGLMINLPQRERKRNYDVDEYFRDALRQGDKPAFFNRAELEVLLAKEDELAGKKHEAVLFIKELRNRAKQQEDDDCEESKRADEMEATLETAYELPVKEAVRKERLLKEGFGDWTRKDLRAFLNAMERHGRGDVDAVARETANETGKTDADVRRYHATFWKKHKDIADWERLVDKVEKGEKRLQRSQEIRSALADKVARHPKPWECLPINYGASRGKVWTEEEDAFLVNMMHTYGYGNWERIRVEIRNAWQFNFDWFFKSRNAQELNRRADLLIRLVEKENEDHRKDAPGAAPAGDAAPAPAKKGRKPAGRQRRGRAGESPDAKQAKQEGGDAPMADAA